MPRCCRCNKSEEQSQWCTCASCEKHRQVGIKYDDGTNDENSVHDWKKPRILNPPIYHALQSDRQ